MSFGLRFFAEEKWTNIIKATWILSPPPPIDRRKAQSSVNELRGAGL